MRGDTLATSRNFARHPVGAPIAEVIAAFDVWRRDLGPTAGARK